MYLVQYLLLNARAFSLPVCLKLQRWNILLEETVHELVWQVHVEEMVRFAGDCNLYGMPANAWEYKLFSGI